MHNGKIISLYLVNGDPEGVICAYISNWTGQAIKIPRNLLNRVSERKELNRPGVYFLIGRENLKDEKTIYIGESENVYKRILQHIKDEDKNFLEHVVIFSSKDEELTKAHIKFLEYKIIEIVKNNSKYTLKNNNVGTLPNLSEMYIAVLSEYLENLKILMSTLGNSISMEKSINRDNKFNLKSLGIEAKGILSLDNKFIVLKGSQIKKENQKSMSTGYKELKDKLIREGIINLTTEQFVKDYEFSSPSAAAVVILGTAVNGKKIWINKGRSLEVIENEEKIKLISKLENA